MNLSLHAASFFLLRTPFEPISTWSDWTNAVDGVPPELHLRALRYYLQRQMERPELLRAIQIASPDLVEAIPRWLADPESDYGSRIETAVVRYFSRLCGRPTPYGLFAGCSVGTVAERTSLTLADQGTYRSHSRLDMDYLGGLVRALARVPEIREGLRYQCNSSLYPLGDRLRYVETGYGLRGRNYRLVALEANEAVRAVLEASRGGLCIMDLMGRIPAELASREEARDFVEGLVEAQALTSNLDLPLTGPEPVPYLLDRLERNVGANGLYESMRAVQSGLERSDQAPLCQSAPYLEWANLLGAHHPSPPISRMFQVDLLKPGGDATLGVDLLGPIQDGVLLLQRLFNNSDRDPLQEFRAAFEDRYGDREVPLLVALDEELGIGVERIGGWHEEENPLLQGVWGAPDPAAGGLLLSPLHQFLLPKITDLQVSREMTINLQVRELEPFFLVAPRSLPDSFSVLLSLAKKQGRIDKIHIHSIWGPPGTALLGRFCHGNPELTEWVRQFHAAEEQRHTHLRFAEIVHQPEDRSGNVILRPLLRRYEIPYLSGSGADPSCQIQPRDLHLSLQGNRLVLRHGKLGPEILPRLTSAQHYRGRCLGIYRFLCELASQDGCCPQWDWGGLACLPFLPRVEVGRLVLAKAIWWAEGRELAKLWDLDGESCAAGIREWADMRRLPRQVLLVDGDNKLPIDFENPLSARMFLHQVKHSVRFHMEELFPAPGHLSTRGPEGAFVSEIVLPFLNQAEHAIAIQPTPEPIPLPGPPGFLPGSEWLYVKLYTGPVSADRVLLDLVEPWVRECQAMGMAERWFFVRYRDPDWHLRVRIHGDPEALLCKALPSLQRRAQPLLESSILWKLQLDTYFPEFRRYGNRADLVVCERLFTSDSDAVMSILAGESSGSETRWRLGLLGMELLLEGFGFASREKQEFLESQWRSLFLGCGFDKASPLRLGSRFRSEKRTLEALLGKTLPTTEPGVAALHRRARIQALILEEVGWSRELRRQRAESLIHMYLNRLLRTAQQAQEGVLYHFLAKHYRTILARSRPD